MNAPTSPTSLPCVVGLVDAGGFRGYLDAFTRRDLLPAKFDRAFAGVTEPDGKAVYNVDAVLAILGGFSLPMLYKAAARDRARLLSELDDLNTARLYKDKGRDIVFVSFGVAICSSVDLAQVKPPGLPTPTKPDPPTKAGPKRKK
jgi:hypothetical protein